MNDDDIRRHLDDAAGAFEPDPDPARLDLALHHAGRGRGLTYGLGLVAALAIAVGAVTAMTGGQNPDRIVVSDPASSDPGGTDPRGTDPPTSTDPPPTSSPSSSSTTTTSSSTTSSSTTSSSTTTTTEWFIDFTANLTCEYSCATPPSGEFWGTANPGALIDITSAYGSGSTYTQPDGSWYLVVFFPTAPEYQPFAVEVSTAQGSRSFPFLYVP